MNRAQLREELFEVIQESTETEVDFDEDTYLLEDMKLSSMEGLLLISDIEDAMDVVVPASKTMDIRTVGDLVDLVADLLREE